MKMELIAAKEIKDRNNAIEAVKSMGWQDGAEFVEETKCSLDDLIGHWYMDMGDDCEPTEVEVRVATRRAKTVTICGMPSRVYFGTATLYEHVKTRKPYLNLKEVG